MKKLLAYGSVFALPLVAPLVAFAQATAAVGTGATDVLGTFGNLVSQATIIVGALALLVFIFGIVRYVIASNEEDKAKGRSFMIWGIIGLFVMVSVWGLVGFLGNTLQVGPDTGSFTPSCPPGQQYDPNTGACGL
ncbi:MAG: hypothetical protein RL641_731 [Candidatus Parcubacteria bacterium]|jgi:FtsH-binding integral membrane protein